MCLLLSHCLSKDMYIIIYGFQSFRVLLFYCCLSSELVEHLLRIGGFFYTILIQLIVLELLGWFLVVLLKGNTKHGGSYKNSSNMLFRLIKRFSLAC